MQSGFTPKEETKLRLLAVLKDSTKPLTPSQWAEKAGVNKVTIYRYIDHMKMEGWLNTKPGPGRSILYSVKANKAVLPVDQIPKGTDKQTKAMPKKELPEMLASLLSKANEGPLITTSTYTSAILGQTLAVLFVEVARARSGEMANKDNLNAAREKLSKVQKATEGMLGVLNGMLLTPELWDPRTINEFLSLNADSIQLGQWAESADDTSDLLIAVLQALTQSNYEMTDSAITFDLS